MKPLLSEPQDDDSLKSLGRAAVQIVHDLKNQLNGLKLYATFLRKRIERTERPLDELETVNKLIAGLDRAASDLSTLTQYGSPIELRKQSGVDVHKIMLNVADTISETSRTTGALNGTMLIDSEPVMLTGEFDPAVMSEALKLISQLAMKMQPSSEGIRRLTVSMRREPGTPEAKGIIEWRGLPNLDHDPFRSFAGSDEIKLSLAARIVEAHGGSAEHANGTWRVALPLK
jgi:signal transduction histidine kinase